MEETIAEKITQFCLSLDYDAIPLEVLEKAKDLILDTAGICIRSSRHEFGKNILEFVQNWGGVPESSLVGSSKKVCMQNAAFANGVLGHGLDYDDTHTESVVHPSACLVPVVMAVGEKTEGSGKEILSALIVGLEVMIRLGMPALNRFHMRGFHTTSICGTFAAAAATGKLLGFDQNEMHDALGVSGSFTSGLLECLSFGSAAKQLHAGWAGLCGIVAAQLAKRSYTGPLSIFEGRLGLYNSFLRSEPLDLDLIFKDIGNAWETLNTRPKLYACCHYLQAFLDCAALLRKANNLNCRSIQKIVCTVSEGAANIVCSPWDKKLVPATDYDTKFSLPAAVSIMLATGRAGFSDFSLASLQNPDVRALMDKVVFEIDPALKVKDMPGAIEIHLTDGSSFAHCIEQVRGDAKHPISREELLEKFYDNCGSVLDEEKSKEIAEQIIRFEDLPNIKELMGQLASV